MLDVTTFGVYFQFQNVVGLALCLVQLLLSFMYPGVKRAHKKMK